MKFVFLFSALLLTSCITITPDYGKPEPVSSEIIATPEKVVVVVTSTPMPAYDYSQTESGKAMWVCGNPSLFIAFATDENMPTIDECVPPEIRSDGYPHPGETYDIPDKGDLWLPLSCIDHVIDGIHYNDGEWGVVMKGAGETSFILYDKYHGWYPEKPAELIRLEQVEYYADTSACNWEKKS